MKKPIIGILGSMTREVMPADEVLTRVSVSIDYFRAVTMAGGMPIMLPLTGKDNIKAQISLCDGLLFPGGMDISPRVYGAEPHQNLNVHSLELDEYQHEFIRTVVEETDKPFLAVCRGYQMLNIVKGGDLYQDLAEIEADKKTDIIKHVQMALSSEGTHLIEVWEGNPLYDMVGDRHYVNSYHHQAIKNLGRDLEVIAEAPDGVIEAVQLTDGSRSFGLGVQWHPEHMAPSGDKTFGLFKMLVEKSLEYAENRDGK